VDRLIRWLWIAPWVALLLFMAKVGTYQNARQLAPYYVFFFPILLALPGHAALVRQHWWRRLAWLISLGTLLMVMAARGCPMFPAQTLLGWLHEKYPHSKAIEHAQFSFSCSQQTIQIQRHAFHSILPPEEKVIGLYGLTCGVEPGYWQPFGIRRVERILPGDAVARVRSLNIHYVVVDEYALTMTHQLLENWLRQYDAELVAQTEFIIRWGVAPRGLYLARLRPEAIPEDQGPSR
jgi:hypothetical protein